MVKRRWTKRGSSASSIRATAASSAEIDGIGIWDRTSNDTGWNFALGDRRGTGKVTACESPSRETDLSNLPATYIEVGSAEVFRDESVAYASTTWASGGTAELHVWPGGYHLFELLAPRAALSAAARDTRLAWLQRVLAPEPPSAASGHAWPPLSPA